MVDAAAVGTEGGKVSKGTLLLFLVVYFMVYMSVAEIRHQKDMVEVKEALKLVKKANALCKEAN